MSIKRRRAQDATVPKKSKKSKRWTDYHSSSEDDAHGDSRDFPKSGLPNAEGASLDRNSVESDHQSDEEMNGQDETSDSDANSVSSGEGSHQDSDTDSASDGSEKTASKKRKRNDPDVFATSMSKILSSKLSTSKRSDPVLSRSQDASIAGRELSDARLEVRAKQKLREDKKAALEKGRIKDVLAVDASNSSTGEVVEKERQLKKTAQRGVIKLFNAVRAAQVKGEEAERKSRESGLIGMKRREEKVTEMSKQGFLDLISGGGRQIVAASAGE